MPSTIHNALLFPTPHKIVIEVYAYNLNTVEVFTEELEEFKVIFFYRMSPRNTLET